MSLQTSTLALPKPKSKRSSSSGDRPKARTWQVSYETDNAEENATGDRVVADKEARGIKSMNAYVKWAVEMIAFRSENVRSTLDLEESIDFLEQDFEAIENQIQEALDDDDTDDDYKEELESFRTQVQEKRQAAIEQLSESLANVSSLLERGTSVQEQVS